MQLRSAESGSQQAYLRENLTKCLMKSIKPGRCAVNVRTVVSNSRQFRLIYNCNVCFQLHCKWWSVVEEKPLKFPSTI